MKKILSLCVALASALTMFAVEVTVSFNTAEGLAAMGITPATVAEGATQGEGVDFTSVTINGVIITGDKGTNKSAPRVWTNLNGSTELRVYKGNNFSIQGAADSDLITLISFAGNDVAFAELTNGQWTGSANSVSFTTTATRKVNVITITMNEEAAVYVPDTISVSEAKALIDANDPKINKGHFVKGVVAGDPFLLGNNGPAFYMTDITNPADSLEGFKIAKDAEGTAFADVNDMTATLGMGDTILIYAAGLALYNNKIYETTSGYFASMLGKSDAIILPWNIADAAYENGNWTITIAATNDANPSDALKLIFPSSETKGIAGFHTLATGSAIKKAGVSLAITSGDVKLTFKSISNNNYNEYDVKMTGLVGESVYRLNNTMEIPAFDADGEEIVLSADRPFVPKDNDTITCAQAREYTLSLGSGESSPMTVTVRGFITDMFSNGVTFWMDDKAGDAKTIEAYSCTMPAGVSLDNGAEVYVTGLLKNYNGTPEVDHGTVSVISGGSQIVAQEVTVAEAVAVAQALAANATSEGYYAITGYISGIAYEYSAQYGNISLWMSDTPDDSQTFQAYRAKCDAAIADKLVVGAKVKVTDKIKHFHQDATEGEDPKPERTVYETYGGGEVILLSGAGVEDINVNAPAVKFIENGRIIILRNGVRYDVQGRIAE